MSLAAAIEVIRTLRKAAALFNPARLQVLESLAEPDSAAGLARRMGIPRQQINYHLHELEKAGLLEFVEERKKGNCIERLVRATARSYVISPDALGKLGKTPEDRRDRFSISYLVSSAARIIRDLTVLRARADRAGKRLSTLTLETQVRFATAADRHAFSEELATAVAQISAKYHNETVEGGRPFRLVLGCFPAITKEQEDGEESVRME